MRSLTNCLFGILFFSVLLCDIPANAAIESPSSHDALLIIWQDCEAPSSENWPIYPTGLIAAVWPDGRIIRAKNKKQVGRSYIEAQIDPKDFKEITRFLTSPKLLTKPDVFLVAIDGPSRTIVIRTGNKKHQWTRDTPDDQAVFNEIENRIWNLSLDKATPTDRKKFNFERLRPREG